MRLFKSHTSLLFFLLLASCFLPLTVSLALPTPTGYVNDFASVLNPSTRQEIESMATQLEGQTGIELSVVTISSLEGETVEDYAVKLFEAWRIGKKEKNNGVLFLIAPNERRARIEVGYGLEGILNDAKATRLLRNKFVPMVKAGQLKEGILQITQDLYQLFSKPQMREGASIQEKSPGFVGHLFQGIVSLIIFSILSMMGLIFFAVFAVALGSSKQHGKYRGVGQSGSFGGFRLGGGGGGFGGFGGGFSGGGGGSVGW